MIKEFNNGVLYNGDCLEIMKDIEDKSIDLILCDLPYGTTACSWDAVIPYEPLWEQYKRIIKDNGAIVLTASQPFTSALVMSNPKMFKCEWIWKKTKGSNFATLNYHPWKMHESVLVFGKKAVKYNPQKYYVSEDKIDKRKNINDPVTNKDGVLGVIKRTRSKDDGSRFPISVQEFSNPNNNSIHPTQKPVPLFEYLIKSYSDEGDTVLDNCSGSGTTGIAAINTNRKFILIERDETYFNQSAERIENHKISKTLF
jgi:site-specific DNA-methyltransferase (adenine-specific)